MAAYRKVKGKWSARIRVKDHPEEFKGKFRTKADAEIWATPIESRLRNTQSMKGLGPTKTTLAVALRDYAHTVTITQGGCVQALCKINKYLRAAGLKTLRATKIRGGRVFGSGPDGLPSELIQTVEKPLFELTEQEEQEVFTGTKQKAFAKRQAANLEMGARSQRHRSVLARMKVSELQPFHLEDLVRLMDADGYKGATQRQEIAIISGFVSHAMKSWNWPLAKNPALSFAWPTGDERERVMTEEESKRMAVSLTTRENLEFVRFVLLATETAMRKGESLWTACWCDVNYEELVLQLPHAKAGRREVPLSPEAISMLQEMPQGKPTDNIFQLTQSAVDSAWKRLCEDAGIVNLHIHDLRHTSATMWAELLNGDIIKLQQITGHRTLKMLQKYLHPTARKVAQHLQTIETPTMSANMREQMALAKSEQSQAAKTKSKPVQLAAADNASSPTTQLQDAVVADDLAAAIESPIEVSKCGASNVVNFASHLERKKMRESVSEAVSI